MRFTKYLLSLLLALGGQAAWAQSIETYDSAYLQPVGEGNGGQIEMLGFGRGGSVSFGPGSALSNAMAVQSMSAPRETFFDTWYVSAGLVNPGLYSLDGFVIDVAGSLQFTSVIFNSFDASPVPTLRSVLFELNDEGTQATGSGTFTVRSECPVLPSCIFIQVIGTQLVDDLNEGYGGDNEFIAASVPEPAHWALLGLGLAVVGSVVRRRRA